MWRAGPQHEKAEGHLLWGTRIIGIVAVCLLVVVDDGRGVRVEDRGRSGRGQWPVQGMMAQRSMKMKENFEG